MAMRMKSIMLLLAISICCSSGVLANKNNLNNVPINIDTPPVNPQLSELRHHKDWVAGCDNIFSCQAVVLQNEPSILIKRNNHRKPELLVQIYNLNHTADRYKIIIDDMVVDTGVTNDTKDIINVTSADALKLARAIAKGYEMEVFDGEGKELGKISLAGSLATLRFIDETQNIARTKDAFVSIGRNDYQALPNVVPHIAVRKISDTGNIPPIRDILRLSSLSGCDKEQYGVTADRVHGLGTHEGKAMALVFISCGLGAYNGSAAPFIGIETDGDWSFEAAKFDFQDALFTNDDGTQVLSNVRWEEDKQILSSYYKGRGLGDCGTSTDYIWDGNMFRLIAASSMDPCRGAIDWIPLWRVKPIFIDDPIGDTP